MRYAAHRVGEQYGVWADEVMENMTFADLAEWSAYQRLRQNENDKLDYYLARITAMLQAKLDPGKRYTVEEFLLGAVEKKTLRDMTSDEVKAYFRSLPFVTYTEAPGDQS